MAGDQPPLPEFVDEFLKQGIWKVRFPLPKGFFFFFFENGWS